MVVQRLNITEGVLPMGTGLFSEIVYVKMWSSKVRIAPCTMHVLIKLGHLIYYKELLLLPSRF